MSHFLFQAGPAARGGLLVAATLALASPAGAQSPGLSAVARADPAQTSATDPRATVPPPAYRSAFQGYRPLVDQPVGDWRALNDRVGRIGGWRTYLREAHEAEAPAPAAPAAPAGAPAAGLPAPPGVPEVQVQEGRQGHHGHAGHPAQRPEGHHRGSGR